MRTAPLGTLSGAEVGIVASGALLVRDSRGAADVDPRALAEVAALPADVDVVEDALEQGLSSTAVSSNHKKLDGPLKHVLQFRPQKKFYFLQKYDL